MHDPLCFSPGARHRTTAATWPLARIGILLGMMACFPPTVGAQSVISGTVFEDVNYGGGAGRNGVVSAGVGRGSARVELYDNTGSFLTFTTTIASGGYNFGSLAPGSYTVRVVNSTVTSSRPGYVVGLMPVQTFRTDASSGIVLDVTNYVGGQDPAVPDAGNGGPGTVVDTTTGVFTAGTSGTAQSIATVTLGASDVGGVDFGFNFDTIVNVNDSGQGSLRQFLTNSVALGNEAGLVQSGSRLNLGVSEALPAARETSIFMVTDGAAHSGLRAGLANQLAAGVAAISVTTSLPAIAGANATGTIVDGTTQTFNIGDTNPSVLGYVGVVGLGPDAVAGTGDEPMLNGVAGPEVQLSGNSTISVGLRLQANDDVLRGMSVYGFGATSLQSNVLIGDTSSVLDNTGCILEQNVLGAPAGSFADPGAGIRASLNVYIRSAHSGFIRNNAMGFVLRENLRVLDARTWQIEDNEFRGSGLGGTFGGVTLISDSSGSMSRNLLTQDSAAGVLAVDATLTAQDNTISNNDGGGFTLWQNNVSPKGFATITQNNVVGNTGPGVNVLGESGAAPSTTETLISKNRFSGNGGIAIDLLPNWSTVGITPNDGTLLGDGTAGNLCGQVLTSGNEGLDFPVVGSAVSSGGVTAIAGRACPGCEVEVYLAVADGDGSDTSGGIDFGEGVRYLGTAAADAVTGFYILGGITSLVVGDEVSAIAIDAANNTSEFSENETVAESTAVELTLLTATPFDSAVELRWQTGSEMNNLGFHVYRSLSLDGPFERRTSLLIPGLGSSPSGQFYSYSDTQVSNGVTYFYKLEDIENTGKTQLHGPVAATPHEGAGSHSLGEEVELSRITMGQPENNRFSVLSDRAGELILELQTEGFYATPQDDGSVQLEIPGFSLTQDEGYPRLPVKRAWVPILAGRNVKLTSIETNGTEVFDPIQPENAGAVVEASGRTVRVRRDRRVLRTAAQESTYPPQMAQLLETAFQEEVKKALVEMAPLRWDSKRQRLVLLRRVVVRLSLNGRDRADRTRDGLRGRGYQRRPSHEPRRVVKRLVTRQAGLYGVRFEEVFSRGRRRPVRADALRLSRQGETVPFHVHTDTFGPGATLYFLSEGAGANLYGDEAVYELEVGPRGERMAREAAVPSGEPTPYYWEGVEKEEERLYQAALVDAPDRWLWSALYAPARESFSFEVSALAAGEPSLLTVWMQGGSDFPADPDHHVRLSVNGSWVGETSWNGKQAHRMDAELGPALLHDGENFLEIESVNDTEAAYSSVMLDRFEVSYPRRLQAREGRLEGLWSRSGTAEVNEMTDAFVIKKTDGGPSWLEGVEATLEGVRFRAEAGGRYMVVSPEAVHKVAEARTPPSSRLKDTSQRADYLVIGPREFLSSVASLMELRRSQGLWVKALAIEEVFSEFGFGERDPKALKDFLSYAYHQWTIGPRYVVLLGDGTYDFKDHLGTGVLNRVPPLMVMTSFLETASDPTYAAVNGDDLLPDLAIGRLPATTVEELQAMVAKIVAFETSKNSLQGRMVIVTDDPDQGGDFVANAEALAVTTLGGRQLEKVYLSDLGPSATRNKIHQAFDEGASLMSYIGHGGIHLWADENIFNIWDVASLSRQSEQPLLLTLNCLNGYFHFPYFNALAEELVKADGKGAIAAFAPSGFSFNEAAHAYHKALLEALLNGGHGRLGDAVLAAQSAYTESGALPEMIAIYHLFGDPAMKLQ